MEFSVKSAIVIETNHMEFSIKSDTVKRPKELSVKFDSVKRPMEFSVKFDVKFL